MHVCFSLVVSPKWCGTELHDKACCAPLLSVAPYSDMIACISNQEHRTLTIKFAKSSPIQVQITSYEAQITWHWLIKQSIYLHNADFAMQKKKFLLLDDRIAGLYHKHLGLKTVSSPGCVFDQIANMDRSRLVFFLLVGGAINLLRDDAWADIGGFLNDSPRALAAMRAVSRRCKRIFTHDAFWEKHDLPSSIYEGRESDYNASSDEMKHELSGLPIFNTLRVKWCALHSSRLRLYMGYLPDRNSLLEVGKDVLRGLLSGRPRAAIDKRNVLCLGADAVISRAAHGALLHLLPPSARITDQGTCLVPGDALLAIDRVQHLQDPGSSHGPMNAHGGISRQVALQVRVERQMEGRASQATTLRIIGDSRLKFVHMLLADEVHSERLCLLRDSGVASILVLPLDSFDLPSASLRRLFQNMYCQVHAVGMMSDTLSVAASRLEGPAKSNPCLVFLPAPSHASATLIASTTRRVHDECILPVIRRERQYILQPFDPVLVTSADLQRGYLRGINWLVKALSKRTVIFGK